MPINFPNSPSPNQQYTYDNKTWEWNGTYWEVYSALTSYITSAYTVGNGYSDISGVTGGNIVLKSFSGVNINIIDGGDTLTFSGNTGTTTGGGTTNYVPKWTGSTGLGNSQIFDNGTNVGIGTISPSAKLDIITPSSSSIGLRVSGDSTTDLFRITQTGSGNAIVVEDETNPDATPFVVAADGRVGIGLTAPLSSYKLHVRNGTATNSVAAAGTVATFESSGVTYITVLSPDSLNGGLIYGSNSDRFGAYHIWNHDNNALYIATAKSGATMRFLTDEQTEQMRIDSSGNVGIGTTSPSAKLDINVSTGGTMGVRISGDSSSDMLRITQTGSGNAILVEDSSNPDSTPFVVTSGGTIGIGITTPDSLLHVHNGSAGSVSAIGGTTMTIENNSTNYLSLLSSDANLSGIVFGSTSDSFGSFIRWGHTSGKLEISTANSNDYIQFGVENAVTKAYVTNTGFGVNTLPSEALDISGNTLLRSGVTLSNLSSSANTRFIVSDSNGVLSYRTDVLTGTTITISGGTGITTGGTYPNFTITNSAPDQTVTISGGTGITTGGTYPNFTLVNSAPDQTVTITGGTNIQINGSYPNFGIDFTGGTILKYYISATTPTGIINNGDRWFNTTDGVELVYVTDGDGPQWVQPNNGGSNTGTTSGGDYLPISGGTVTGNTTFSSGVTLNALTSSEEINNIVADSAGNLYTYTDGVTISAGSDPAVNSGMFKTNRTVDIGGTFYRVYNIKANVTVPGANNTFVNYIGVVSGSTNYTLSTTKSLVVAQDPTFNRVQTPLTTYALVYDETLLFAAPVDLMTVNYDNTLGNPDEYYIFSIAANTNNFSCDLQVDYEFLVLETDVITFTN
jgi:hypothetical protein